jgi:hypothetical protein
MGASILAGVEGVGIVDAELYRLGYMFYRFHSAARAAGLTTPGRCIANNANGKTEKKEKKYLFHHICRLRNANLQLFDKKCAEMA